MVTTTKNGLKNGDSLINFENFLIDHAAMYSQVVSEFELR